MVLLFHDQDLNSVPLTSTLPTTSTTSQVITTIPSVTDSSTTISLVTTPEGILPNYFDTVLRNDFTF